MPDQACLDNIKKQGGVYCNDIDPGFCNLIQPDINEYCHHLGLPANTPVPQMANGKKCYCCCGGGAVKETPVEIESGEYKSIQDIDEGDKVLATDADVKNWEKREATILSGVVPGVELAFMYYTVFEFNNGSKDQRAIVCTADHLFLLPNGKLVPIQGLAPGDEVRSANGGTAKMLFAVPGEYSGGVRYIGLGDWKRGDSLDGHLLNFNGIVMADLSVQLNYYGGNVPEDLVQQIAADRIEEPVGFDGTKEYLPRGFKPHTRSPNYIPAGGNSERSVYGN